MVGRLVYEVFIAPGKKESMAGMLVRPKDGNGLNCSVNNLQLVTYSQKRKLEFLNNRYKSNFHLFTQEKRLALQKKASRAQRKKIKKYSVDGVLLKTYASISSAARNHNVSISCVSLCAQQKINILKGFVFRFEADEYGGALKNWRPAGFVGVVQYSLGGKKLHTWQTIREAAKNTAVNPNCISDCIYKRARHAGGFVWRLEGEKYSGEYKNILKKRKCIQLTPDGKKIKTFESIARAVKETGADFSSIKRTLEGKRKTCKGFTWKWG